MSSDSTSLSFIILEGRVSGLPMAEFCANWTSGATSEGLRLSFVPELKSVLSNPRYIMKKFENFKFLSEKCIFFAVFGRVLPVDASPRAENKMASRTILYLNFPNSRARDSKYLMEKARD